MKENLKKQDVERLNSFATLIKNQKTAVTYRGDRFYLMSRLQDRRVPLASFTSSDDLKRTLLLLAHAESVTPDVLLEERIRLWNEQNVFAERRKTRVYAARKLDFPEAALRQQATMEEAWALRARERLCAAARNWLDVYGRLPVHAGIENFEEHDPAAENEDDPVFCSDYDWLSGESRHHYIRNFSAVYLSASSYPEQNYLVQLRRFYTPNIWHAWERVVESEILPLMKEIRETLPGTRRGREIIRKVKAVVAPWSIPRPWPAVRTKRKCNMKVFASAPSRRCQAAETQAVTA